MMIKMISRMENMTKEMAKNMFRSNPNFKETIQEIISESDIDYAYDEYLNHLKVDFTLNSCYNPWYGHFDALQLSDDILTGSWDFGLYNNDGELLDWEKYEAEMANLRHRLNSKVPLYSRSYDLLEEKLSKMIVIFLNSLQDEVDRIINYVYTDDDYLIDQFIDCIRSFIDGYYLDEDTLKVFKYVG